MGGLNRIDMDKYVATRRSELSKKPSSADQKKIADVINKYPELTQEEVFNKILEDEAIQRKGVRKAGKALDKLFGIIINQNDQYNRYYLDTAGRFNI
jgi:hypothetical protein